ncbi:MAG: hypothetical protein ACI4D8_01760 [Wujia sp.]
MSESNNRENNIWHNTEAEPGEEMLSDAELEAFYQMAEQDTPDLWNRIETGYQNEINLSKVVDMEAVRKKKVRRKYFGAVAAIVLVVLIAVPTMMLKRDAEKSEDGITGDYSGDVKEDTEFTTTALKEANENVGCESDMAQEDVNQIQDNSDQTNESAVDDEASFDSESSPVGENEMLYKEYQDRFGTLTLQDVKSVEMYYDGDEETTRVVDDKLEKFISELNKLQLCEDDMPELFFDDEVVWYNVTYSDERFVTIIVGEEGIIIDNDYYSAPEKQLSEIKNLIK